MSRRVSDNIWESKLCFNTPQKRVSDSFSAKMPKEWYEIAHTLGEEVSKGDIFSFGITQSSLAIPEADPDAGMPHCLLPGVAKPWNFCQT